VESSKFSVGIITALIPIVAALATVNNYGTRIEKLELKIARLEVKMFYQEKRTDELAIFKKWCEKIYKETRIKWKLKNKDG
jgi:hypothetical protein